MEANAGGRAERGNKRGRGNGKESCVQIVLQMEGCTEERVVMHEIRGRNGVDMGGDGLGDHGQQSGWEEEGGSGHDDGEDDDVDNSGNNNNNNKNNNNNNNNNNNQQLKLHDVSSSVVMRLNCEQNDTRTLPTLL